MSRCDECGFDWEADAAELAGMARAHGERFPRPLSRFLDGEDPDAVLRTRPEPTVWSALEYAAHTRDGFDFYIGRIRRVLEEERPQLAPMDPDRLCDERKYNEEDPAETAASVTRAANELASLLDALEPAHWHRIGIGIDGDERTVLVLARRAAHEGHHHMLDIGRVLRRVRQAPDS